MDNNTQPTPTPEPVNPSPTKSGSSKNMMVILAVLVLIILGLGGYILLRGKSTTYNATNPPVPTTSMESQMNNSASPSPTNTDLLTYTSTDKTWQIMYPKDVTVEKKEGTYIGPDGTGEVAVFYKHGPTQTTGTEFHDGLAVIIGTVKKPAATTLSAFVDQQNKPNPEVNMTKTPQASITVGGLTGITTTVTSLGTAKLIYLPVPNNSELVYYISITTEGDQKTAYEQVANDMLSSFKLL